MKIINKLNYTLLSFTLIMALLFSCSSDDDNGVQVQSPDIDYPENQKTVSFMESGEFEAPMIEWNGEEGTLAIMNSSLEGVFINETTGKVNFDGSMPLGVTEIIISAQNTAGEATQSLVLEHVFDAEMTGGFNFDINDETDFPGNLDFIFYADGTFERTVIGTGEGTWTREANFFTLEQPSGLVHEGELSYDGTNAFMTGEWADPNNSNNDFNDGNFYLELTD